MSFSPVLAVLKLGSSSSSDQLGIFLKRRTLSDYLREVLFGNSSGICRLNLVFITGLPSSVCMVYYAFIMAVSVYQTSKTKGEIRAFETDDNKSKLLKLLPCCFTLFFCV